MSPASHMVGRLRKLYGLVLRKMRSITERQMDPLRHRPGIAAICEALEPRLLLDAADPLLPDPGQGSGITPTNFGSIVPIVQETGHVSLSVDGLGTSQASGVIQVQKPAGAKVRCAYMAAASTGFSGYRLVNGDVAIDGQPVLWSITTPSNISSYNVWADVTSLVRNKLDTAPAGQIDFTIGEVNTSLIDGEILAVIFDDPNQNSNNTIALLFGAQNVVGDTFALALAEPLDTSDPRLALDMSLGISFGYQPSSQYSTVSVNGQLVTSSAGGQDDGAAANGALLTVGGIGDSNANPASPSAPPTDMRSDDELYSLLPFVHNGDQAITIFTRNPSSDDNIFFAAFCLSSTTAVVGEGIVLGPPELTCELGTQSNITAALQTDTGAPIVNRAVHFFVVDGPNAGRSWDLVTDASGRVALAYTSYLAGNDEVQARFVNSQGQTLLSNVVLCHWENNAPWIEEMNPSGDVTEPVSSVVVTFAEPIDSQTFTRADVMIEGPAGQIAVASDPVYLGPGVYGIAFAQQSAYGQYRVVVGPNIFAGALAMDQDRDGVRGEQSDDQFVGSFTILDVAGPRVVGHEPAVPVNGTLDRIRLTFNEPMRRDSMQPADVRIDGPDGPVPVESIDWESDLTVGATFAPVSTAGVYSVTVGPNITDAAGNLMDQDLDGLKGEAQDDRYAFDMVIDRDTPRAAGNSATGVHNRAVTTIDVTFDEDMADGSLAAGDVTISGPSGSYSATGVQRIAPDTFRIAIPARLANGTFTVTLAPTVTDLAGNRLDQDGDGVGGEPAQDAYQFSFVQQLADLSVTRIAFPAECVGGQQVDLSWTVTNLGLGVAEGGWTDTAYISTDATAGSDTELVQLTFDQPLAPGESYTRAILITIPADSAGNRWFVVKTDSQEAVDEPAGGQDNTTVSPSATWITTRPYPDLRASAVAMLDTLSAGERATVSWTVSNFGTGPTSASYWYDEVWLSTNPQLDGSDIRVAQVRNLDFLGPGESYTQTAEVLIADSVPRNSYYLIVKTDGTDREEEFNREDNNDARSDTQASVITPTPPFLRVTDIQTPLVLQIGSLPTATWTITNTGGTTISTGWSGGTGWDDAWALSADESYDENQDYWLGSHNYWHGLPLGPGQSYTQTGHAEHAVPNWAPGTYYLIVLPDTHWGAGSGFGQSTIARDYGVIPVTLAYADPPDLRPIAVSGPAVGVAGQDIPLDWRVENQGVGNTRSTSWTDTVYLSSDPTLSGEDVSIGSRTHSGALNPGTGYDVTAAPLRVPGNLATGSYYVLVKTDGGGAVSESNEANNVVASTNPVAVVEPVRCDLQVISADGPAAGIAGQEITVQWSVVNNGPEATTSASWYDGIYLSADDVLDANDRRIAEFPHAGALGAGDGYQGQQTFLIPDQIEGTFHLFVKVDSRNTLYEHNAEANNALATDNAIVVQDLAPDLQVASIDSPATGIAGYAITVDWQVTNAGSETAQPTWRDAIYLSRDATLDIENDTLLASYSRQAALEVGSSYDPAGQTTDIMLPDGIQGDYHLFFVTDDQAGIYEKDAAANNVASRIIEIIDYVPDLRVVSMTSPATGAAGGFIAVDFRVTNEGTEEAAGQWRDAFYLSADDQFDPASDRLFGQLDHSTPVAVGGTYGPPSSPVYLRLPDRIEGEFHIFVVTDVEDSLEERDGEANNVFLVPTPIQVALTPADLIASDVEAPEAATAGSAIQVNWMVVNQGRQATEESLWQDGVYLSTDTVFEPASDIELGVVSHSGALAPGTAYSGSEFFDLRQDLEGPYYVYVVADVRHQVFEHVHEDNNTAQAALPMTVTGVHADLQVSPVTVPADGVAGRDISVTWTVTNAGPDATAASAWSDTVYLSDDAVLDASDVALGTFRHNGRLAAGEQYVRERTVTLPQSVEGTHFILVKTDSNAHNEVYEFQGEGNNVGAAAIELALAPPADLRVTTIVAPTTAWSGQDLHVEWTVANLGGSATEAQRGGWYDSVYLSRDPYLDPANDLHLGTKYHQGDLAADGGSYGEALDARLPAGVSGPYYVLVRTDTTDRVFERGLELNNTTAALPTVDIHLTPPCDLQVTAVTPPLPAVHGEQIAWTYQVTNMDTLDAMGAWYDALYLSADSQWDIGDVRIGRVHHQGDVPHAQSYTESLIAAVPAVIPGDYYVIVRTDILNDIRELNDSNNTGVSVGTVHIQGHQLAVGTAVEESLAAGEAKYYQVNVDAGADFAVILSGAAANDAEIYVAFGRIPTRAQSDAKSTLTSDGRQMAHVSATQAGAYYVLVYGDQSSGTLAYSLLADPASFSIRSVSPGTVGDSGRATLTVEGDHFNQDTAFELVSDAGAAPAASVFIQNSTLAYVTFDCAGLPVGDYALRAVLPEQTPAVLDNAVRIVEGTGADIQAAFDGPLLVRSRRPGVIQLQYSNQGDADGASPLFLLETRGDTLFGLDSAALAANRVIQVLGLSHDGPLGVLRPGTAYTLPVYYRGQNTQTDVRARVITADDTTAIDDWSAIEAGVRFAGLTDQQWSPFWANIRTRIPSTWGAYVTFLNRVADMVCEPGHPVRDARELFELLYAADSNFHASSSLSGRLLDSGTGQAIANAEIAVYQVVGNTQVLGGFVQTGADGSFSINYLPPASYQFVLTSYAFDMDRDGTADENGPTQQVTSAADITGLALYAMRTADAPIVSQSSGPALATDNLGVAHLIYEHGDGVWYARNDGQGWTDAHSIAQASGLDLSLEFAGAVPDGRQVLVATWENGAGNDAEIYMAVGVFSPAAGTTWSQPVQLTDDSVRDSSPAIVGLADGSILVTFLKKDVSIQDDTDVYYLVVDPTDYAAFVASTGGESDQTQQMEPQDQSHHFGFVFDLPDAEVLGIGIRDVGLDLGLDFAQEGCEASASGGGELSGEVRLPGFGSLALAGGGSVAANYKADKKTCEWVFDEATIDASGSVTVKWKDGLMQILHAIPLPQAQAAYYGIRGAVGFIEAVTPIRIGNGVQGELEVEVSDLRWFGTKIPLAFWGVPPTSVGEVSVSISLGPYISIEAGEWLDIEVSGSIGGKAEIYPTFKPQFTFGLSFSAQLGWFSYEGSWSGSWPKYNSVDEPFAVSETDGLPEGIEFRYNPAGAVGTDNVYGNNSLLHDVASNLFNDGSPALAHSATGQTFAAWTRDADSAGTVAGSQLVVADFSGGAWADPVNISGAFGLIGSVDATFDPASRPMVVWSMADTSGLTPASTANDLHAVMTSADLYYSVHANGAWTAPSRIVSTAGKDSELSLAGNAEGGITAAWTWADESGNTHLVTAVWDGSAWSASVEVDSGNVSHPSVAVVGGKTTVMWTQDVDPSEQQQLAIYSSIWSAGAWSSPQAFAPELAAVTAATGGTTGELNLSGWIPPFDVPDDCCKCQDWTEQTKGSGDCFVGIELDEDNCIEYSVYRPCDSGSKDPNDILGPTGYGDARWVAPDGAFSYTVRFENQAEAEASAQLITITHQLDAGLDWNTFQFRSLLFGNHMIDVPGGLTDYHTQVDLRPGGNNLIVDILAHFDEQTGLATWTFTGIDPQTGELTEDPLAGFLPPNDPTTGAGEGFVSYSVRPKDDLASGDELTSEATIIFDWNEPIDTPIWQNTIDVGTPTSAVDPLPAAAAGPEFQVSWTGTDDTDGVGIWLYDVFVSTDGSGYVPWLLDRENTSAVFAGAPGHTYAFYSLARDYVGHLEAAPATADATTRTPPGPAIIGDRVWLDWDADGVQDAGEAGVGNVTVNLYTGDGQSAGTTTTDATGFYRFAGLDSEQQYYLAVIAPDGMIFSPADQGSDDTLDSDVEPATGRTVAFAVSSGENAHWDIGLYEPAEICGVVWNDANTNGQQDAGEAGLPGRTVFIDDDQNGVPDSPALTTTTDADGNYRFSGLTPGQHVVAEVSGSGWRQVHPGPTGSNDRRAGTDPLGFGEVEYIQAGGSNIQVLGYSTPSMVDWNDDGLADLVVGEKVGDFGKVRVYLNHGQVGAPVFDSCFFVQAGGQDLMVSATGCLGVFPRVADWNGDGAKDLLLGLANGSLLVYPNIGADADPVFDAGYPLQVGQPGAKVNINVGARATPEVADWNHDGWLDLVVGALDGRVRVYLNEGTPAQPDLRAEWVVQQTDGDLVVPSGRSSPVVADIDGDGLRDLVLGNTDGEVYFYRNTGSNVAPAFEAGQPLQSAGTAIQLGTSRSRPFVFDVDNDGLSDLVVGGADGLIRLYRREVQTHAAYTTDGSREELFAPGVVSIGQAGSSAGDLIGLDQFHADPRYAGIDGSGLAVVIIDTGIDLDHPFFGSDANADGVADRIVYQYDFADGDSDAGDRIGHGSNVTSIVASSDADHLGVAPGVNIIHLKVFGDDGRGQFSYAEQALQWVIQNATAYHVAAVNLSFGDQGNWGQSTGLFGISDELATLAAMDVIVVASAGNGFATFYSQPGVAYPAADPNVIAVGAVWDADHGGPWTFSGTDYTTDADRIAAFSQRHGDLLDVFAPGVIVEGADAHGGTVTMTGTSQAAPFVTGAAALVQQFALERLGRSVTPYEFASMLQSTGRTIVDGDDENDSVVNTNLSFSRLDVLAMVDGVTRLDPDHPDWGDDGSGGWDGGVNTGGAGAISELHSRPYAHTLVLHSGEVRENISFGNEQVNTAPTAEAGGPYSVTEGGTVTLAGSGSDLEQDAASLTYEWDLDGDGIFGETGEAARQGDEVGTAPAFNAAGLDGPSSYTVTLRVTDDHGAERADTAVVNVLNAPPVIGTTSVPASALQGATINLSAAAADPAGPADPLTFAWDFGDSTPAVLGSSVTHAFAAAGSYTVTLTVTDGDGGQDSRTFQVSVQALVQVQDVLINNGAAQRSNIETLAIRFSGASNIQALIDAGTISQAVQVWNGAQVILAANRFRYDASTFRLTVDLTVDGFGGSAATMLTDCNYQLRMNAGLISAAGDPNSHLVDDDGTADGIRRYDFFRLQGDFDGNRVVDMADRTRLMACMNTRVGSATYDRAYDLNGDGVINISDYMLWTKLVGRRI